MIKKESYDPFLPHSPLSVKSYLTDNQTQIYEKIDTIVRVNYSK